MTYGEKWLCEKKWRNILTMPHVPEWERLETFLAWCELSGYQEGLVLRRARVSKPFGPGNCYWMKKAANGEGDVTTEDIRKWNKTVNVFRKHYGLPLFEE